MQNSDLKAIFLGCLSGKLKKEGYNYVKTRSAYVKKVDIGEFWYTLTFLKYSGQGGFELNPGLHIRFNEIETVFHETSNFSKKNQKGTSTIGCSLENYLNNGQDMFRKYIEFENDALEACSYYLELFYDKIDPFFKKYSSLESLNKLINAESNSELSLINSIFRGTKGVIIAHLLRSEKIHELIKVYSQQYENFYNGFYKPDFDKTIENILEN